MPKKAVGYVIVILMTLYFFFMYDSPFFSGLLVLELLYPVSAYIYIGCIKKDLTVKPRSILSMGEAKKRMQMVIIVKNKSALWNIKYRLYIGARNGQAGKKTKYKLEGIAEPRAEKKAYCEMESQYCGLMIVSAEYLEIYDFMGILSRKINLSQQRTVGIMPEFSLQPIEITRRTREFPTDADEHSLERAGQDPSAIYQVREYRAGDSIHDIHWKLTAKEEELMIKERALPLGCAVLVWVDFQVSKNPAKALDVLVTQTASLAISLVAEKCIHIVAWFEEKNQRVVKYKIDSEEAVYECIWYLLGMEPYKDAQMRQVYYEEAFRGQGFSSVVRVQGNGRITVNKEEQELLQI